MITKVYDYVKKYRMIEEGDTIVAGISGGADSVCLLFVLLEIRSKINFQLAVAHINHGIRKEAGMDADYVKQLCAERGIPFYLTEVNIKKYAAKKGLSEEEAGREVRYRAFEEALICEGELSHCAKIAVAHNSNDRAETILFHLFRGTGLKGLSGILPVSGRIIRPLLCLERKEIESWLLKKEISYCHDYTNEQDIYTRNRIRHHVLPFAEKEICKGAVGHISRTGEYLQQAEEFIERKTNEAMQRCCHRISSEEISFEIPALRKEDSYLQRQILLSGLSQISPGRKDITASHIDSMEELLYKDGSKEIHLPYGIMVCKEYDRVTLKRKTTEYKSADSVDSGQIQLQESLVKDSGEIIVPGLGIVEFAVFSYDKSENIPQKKYTKWFDYDKINQLALFRKRMKGDYLTINSQMNKKSLQDYLVNQKIPKAERDEMHLLADGSHIMWIPGHRISEYYKVTEDTRQILEITVKERCT